MEDYKKKYEGLIKNIEHLHKSVNPEWKRIIECYIPELKESEEERIRKELIGFFKSRGYNCSKRFIAWLEKQKPIQNINKEDEEVRQYIIRIMKQRDINVPMVQKAVAWLKKQGEKKSDYKIEPKFKVGDIIKYVGEREEFSKEEHTIKKILDDCYLTIDDVYIPFKFEEYYILVNKNPSWSEEDEANMDVIWKACGIVYGAPHNIMLRDWLKSLKERVQPKQKCDWSEDDERIFTLCALSVKTRYNDGLLTHHEYELATLWLESQRKICLEAE